MLTDLNIVNLVSAHFTQDGKQWQEREDVGNLFEITVVIFSIILNKHQWSENLRYRTGNCEFIITNLHT